MSEVPQANFSDQPETIPPTSPDHPDEGTDQTPEEDPDPGGDEPVEADPTGIDDALPDATEDPAITEN